MAVQSYSTDKFALGAAMGGKSGVYPQAIEFSTAAAPGSGSFAISTRLAISDTINLFYLPVPGRLHGYSIDFPATLDSAASGVCAFTLEDSLGNVYEATISASASRRITDATAVPGVVGQILYGSGNPYMRLRATTSSLGLSAATYVTGTARYKNE